MNANLNNIQTIMEQYMRKTGGSHPGGGLYLAGNFEEQLNLTKALSCINCVPEEVVGDQVREARVGPQDGSDALDVLARGDVRL